jgi:DNA-binding MarR family transcriptional regulator
VTGVPPFPPPDDDIKDRDLAALLRAAFVQQKQEVAVRLSQLGVSSLQARALQHIEASTALTTKQLAAALGTEPSNLTVVIDHLEEAGLIERIVPMYDRRAKQLKLTPVGIAMHKRIESEAFAGLTVFKRLSRAERSQLARLLDLLAHPQSD